MGWASGSRWYRQKITISGSNVAGDVTDFPVAINIPTGNDVFTNADTGGTDIFFTADDGETFLDFERSIWDKAGSEGIFYVKTGLLSSSDNEIYMYYGGADLTDFEDTANTWDSNFSAVLHFEDGTYTGAANEMQDSSGNGNHARRGSGNFQGTDKDWGQALNITDSDDWARFESNLDITAEYTISCIFWIPLSNSTSWHTLTRGSSYHQIILQNDHQLGNYLSGFHSCGFDMDSLSTGIHHVAVVRKTNGTGDFYVDGSYVGNASSQPQDDIYAIGNYQGNGQHWGQIDEFRVSASYGRNASWLAVEAENLLNNSDFLSFSSREVSPYLITTSPHDFPTAFTIGEVEAIGGVRQILTEYTQGESSTIYYDMPVYFALTDVVSGTRDVQNEFFVAVTGTLGDASLSEQVELFVATTGTLGDDVRNINNDFTVGGIPAGVYGGLDVDIEYIQGHIVSPSGTGEDVDVEWVMPQPYDTQINQDVDWEVATSNLQSGDEDGRLPEEFLYETDSYSSTYSGTVVFDIVGEWYDYAWPYRQKVTVNSALVMDDFTGFPVAIKIDDSNHGVFDYAQSDGDDILFTNASGVKLDHELSVFIDDSADVDDDFTGANGTAPDDTKWTYSAGVQIQNNKLWIETDSTNTYRQVTLIDTLKGDFNVEVDYELIVYPNTHLWYHALEIRPAGSAVLRYRMKRQYRTTGGQQYGTEYYNGNSWTTPNYTSTSDTSGKLRISRSGDTIYAYYWNGMAWVTLTTFNGAWSGEVEVRLFGYSGGSQPTRSGYFDNFSAASSESILVAYVKSDLSFSSDTDIYMYYGNLSASDQSNATAVWTGYQGVYHFEDTDGTLRDSTSAGRDGTAVAGFYGGDRGVLGSSWYSRGNSGDYVSIPQATGLVITGTSPKTASTYFMPLEDESATPTHAAVLRWSNDLGFNRLWLMSVDNNEAYPYCNSYTPPDNAIAFHGFGGGSNVCTGYRLSDLSPLEDWYSYSATYGYGVSNRLQLFWDGQARGYRDNTLTLDDGDTILGGRSTQGFRFKYTELRLFDGAKSPEWLETEHNSIIEIDSFLTLDSEEELAYHWELDDYIDAEIATVNSGTGEGGYLWPFPADVFSSASGTHVNYDIDLYVSLCNTVPSGQVYKSPEVWPVASGYYFLSDVSTSGTLIGYTQDLYVSLTDTIDYTVSGAVSSGNRFSSDIRLHALEIDNFFLDIDEYTTAAGVMHVDIYDKRNVQIDTTSSYFVVSGTQVPVTFSGIEVQTTDLGQPIVVSGYRMFFDSPTDFFADEPIEIVAHGANVIGDILERTYYLLYGYNLIYDTPPEVVWGWGNQIIVWATAKNKASCPATSTDSWWFEIRPKEHANLGATIVPTGYANLPATIYPQLQPNTFFYGAKVTVIVRVKDEAGNEMEPFVLNFTIEDNPN